MMDNLKIIKDKKINAITTKELFGMLKDNGDIQIEYVFMTTYDGMDMLALEDIMLYLPGGNRFIEKGEYDIYCGAKNKIQNVQDSYLAELLLKKVHRVNVKKSFHPKIYMIFYKKSGEEKVFLCITSRNITRNEALDAYACFEGSIAEEGENTNGCHLKEVLSKESFLGGIELHPKIRELPRYDFKCISDCNVSVDFVRPNEAVFKAIMDGGKSGMPVIVVSPFVTDGIWQKYNNIRLYTSEATADRLASKPDKGLYYLNPLLEDTQGLHAKIYIKNAGEVTEVYIGSANYTKSAFSDDNSEILARLIFQDHDGKIYQEFSDSFACDNDGMQVWIEAEELKGINDEKKHRIPSGVYDCFQSLSVHAKQVKDTEWSFEYKIKEKPVHAGSEIKIGENGKITIRNITPSNGVPSRNGNIEFVYSDKEMPDTVGNFAFDVADKMSKECYTEAYCRALEALIKENLTLRKNRMLQSGRLTGAVRRRDDSNTGNDIKRTRTTRTVTLFDIVMQRKLYYGKEEIVQYLQYFYDNLVGELTRNEKELLNIFGIEVN